MKLRNESIRIERAEGNARRDAVTFIQQHYMRAFGTRPIDEPDHIFVACNTTEILGTIGISLWKQDEPMRLALIYEFDCKQAPCPIIPEKLFEYNRLIATKRGISKALIAVASTYALSIGRTCGWCEHTDAVHRICTSFGLEFYSVDASVREDAIAEGDREFYRRNPSIRLYMTAAEQWACALADSVTNRNGYWIIR